jgi:hypothetical protein
MRWIRLRRVRYSIGVGLALLEIKNWTRVGIKNLGN